MNQYARVGQSAALIALQGGKRPEEWVNSRNRFGRRNRHGHIVRRLLPGLAVRMRMTVVMLVLLGF